MSKPKCKLAGESGNAFGIIFRVSQALKEAGQDDKAQEFRTKAMQGDYDHLLSTVMEYVDDAGEELDDEAA